MYRLTYRSDFKPWEHLSYGSRSVHVRTAEGLDANPGVTSMFRKGREILKKRAKRRSGESVS